MGKLLSLAMSKHPWSHIAIDFLQDLPESMGNTVIKVIVNHFSKSLHRIPLPGLPTAFEMAELFFNHVFRYFGIPEGIVSDRGMQITSRMWASFMEKLEGSISFMLGYHYQSNDQANLANQINRLLSTNLCSDNEEDWAQFLLLAEYAQKSLCIIQLYS